MKQEEYGNEGNIYPWFYCSGAYVQIESEKGYVQSFLQREGAGVVWRLSMTQEARERAGSAGFRVESELCHTHSSSPLAALFPGACYPKCHRLPGGRW